jgi:hypothetical protein
MVPAAVDRLFAAFAKTTRKPLGLAPEPVAERGWTEPCGSTDFVEEGLPAWLDPLR